MLDDAQRQKYKPSHNLLKNWQVTETFSKARNTYWWQKPLAIMKK
ncbi:hypothetical protein ACP6PL_25210 [Dapis sp. BLCC M126]